MRTDSNATLYQGHALEVLKDMDAESVDCVITSPPYWGLRSYKTEPIVWDNHNDCEHEWIIGGVLNVGSPGSPKPASVRGSCNLSESASFCLKCNAWRGELGLEPTIELYISHLLQVFTEVKRVLKKTGTLWVNLGDSYYGGGFGHEKDLAAEQFLKKYPKQGSNAGTCMEWQERKMVGDTKRGNLLPAKSLCLIPERFALGMVNAGWILRNDIIWYKQNPMPESVKDRFTGAYEHIYFFVRNKRYYFEQQFEPQLFFDNRASGMERQGEQYRDRVNGKYSGHKDYGGGGTSFQGHSGYYKANGDLNVNPLGRNKRDVWEINTQPYPEAHFATFPEKLVETPILSGCPVNGVVLDPFAGSGTTLAVAKKLGRKTIGIELNPNYYELAIKRISKIPIPMELSI